MDTYTEYAIHWDEPIEGVPDFGFVGDTRERCAEALEHSSATGKVVSREVTASAWTPVP